MSPERALAAALRAAILGDPACAALIADRVHDEAPLEAVFPFLTLGEVRSQAADSAGASALEHTLTLHAWSRYGGKAEAMEVLSALRSALHDRPLAVAGRRLVLLLGVFTDVFRAPDGRTTHGVLRLRAITEAA